MANIPQERRKTGPAKAQRSVRILVVEDDAAMRRMICRALEGGAQSDRPFLLQEAVSVEAALQAFQSGGFELVVLDLGFPGGLQGGDLLKRLRQGGVDVPILVVTGNYLGLDCNPFYRLGAADVLPKPFHIYELRAAVSEILAATAAARRPAWREAAARVLHVEDTDDWAALGRLWLDQAGYASHSVGCRAGLMRFLRSCREMPDCILLDLSLPDGDGLALCDELKGQPDFQAIPVVVFTARGEDRLAALRHRAVQVVLKPQGSGQPARDEVMAVIDSVVDQSERTRGVIRKAGLKLDPRGNGVFIGPKRVAELDSAKFSILRLLLDRSPRPVPEEELRACLPRLGYKRHHPEDPDPKTVAVYISGIRGRLASAPLVQISNIPGQGYALRELDGETV